MPGGRSYLNPLVVSLAGRVETSALVLRYDCPDGSALQQAFTGEQVCTCNAGYTGPDWGPCVMCEAGKYKYLNGSYPCLECHANSHAPEGSAGCMCNAGFTDASNLDYSITAANATPNQAVNGVIGIFLKARALSGSDSIAEAVQALIDTEGTSQSLYDQLFSNEFNDDEGACEQCPAGKYKASISNQACEDCGVGTYRESLQGTSADSCTACDAGKFSTAQGATACNDCMLGKYSARAGSDTEANCIACPSGKFSSSTGGSSAGTCQTCIWGKYASATSDRCVKCPAGKLTAPPWQRGVCRIERFASLSAAGLTTFYTDPRLDQLFSADFVRDEEVFNDRNVWRSGDGRMRLCRESTDGNIWNIKTNGEGCDVGGRLGYLYGGTEQGIDGMTLVLWTGQVHESMARVLCETQTWSQPGHSSADCVACGAMTVVADAEPYFNFTYQFEGQLLSPCPNDPISDDPVAYTLDCQSPSKALVNTTGMGRLKACTHDTAAYFECANNSSGCRCNSACKSFNIAHSMFEEECLDVVFALENTWGYLGVSAQASDISDDFGLENGGQACWDHCQSTTGFCAWCGTGMCCRQGYEGDGCNGTGVADKDYHHCVPRMPMPNVSESHHFLYRFTVSFGELDVLGTLPNCTWVRNWVRTGPDEWHHCANQDQVCTCSGRVRYGVHGTFSEPQQVTGQIFCSDSVFGDTIHNYSKWCECETDVEAANVESFCDVLPAHLPGDSPQESPYFIRYKRYHQKQFIQKMSLEFSGRQAQVEDLVKLVKYKARWNENYRTIRSAEHNRLSYDKMPVEKVEIEVSSIRHPIVRPLDEKCVLDRATRCVCTGLVYRRFQSRGCCSHLRR